MGERNGKDCQVADWVSVLHLKIQLQGGENTHIFSPISFLALAAVLLFATIRMKAARGNSPLPYFQWIYILANQIASWEAYM